MIKSYINSAEIKSGFQKCHKIINRLLNDSELLLKNGRFSSSVALAILAHEELGKAEYLRKKFGDDTKFDKNEWQKISSGGKSHLEKLKALLNTKLELEKEYAQRGKSQDLPKIISKIGLIVSPDVEAEKKYAQYLFEIIFPALNLVKQDCFYLNWDDKKKEWVYFENRFNEKIKKTIASFLIKETRHDALVQRIMFNSPKKSFGEFTMDDWRRYYKSKDFVELIKIRPELFSPQFALDKKIAFSAIEQNYVNKVSKKILKTNDNKKL